MTTNNRVDVYEIAQYARKLIVEKELNQDERTFQGILFYIYSEFMREERPIEGMNFYYGGEYNNFRISNSTSSNMYSTIVNDDNIVTMLKEGEEKIDPEMLHISGFATDIIDTYFEGFETDDFHSEEYNDYFESVVTIFLRQNEFENLKGFSLSSLGGWMILTDDFFEKVFKKEDLRIYKFSNVVEISNKRQLIRSLFDDVPYSKQIGYTIVPFILFMLLANFAVPIAALVIFLSMSMLNKTKEIYGMDDISDYETPMKAYPFCMGIVLALAFAYTVIIWSPLLFTTMIVMYLYPYFSLDDLYDNLFAEDKEED